MQSVIGLGNPGREYASTRHNAGWLVIDALRDHLNASPWAHQSKFHGDVAQKNSIYLLKPDTFMNESGRAARALLQFYDKTQLQSAKLQKVWVIHDDLDIALGSYKIQFGRGPKIHNGLLSLYQQLGSEQFWHVRVGVDNRQGDRTLSGSEYVLQPFSPAEQAMLTVVSREIVTDLGARLLVE